MLNKPAPSLFHSCYLPFLYVFDFDLNATSAFASHIAVSDYIKECLQANVRALECMNQLVGLNRTEDFPIYNLA